MVFGVGSAHHPEWNHAKITNCHTSAFKDPKYWQDCLNSLLNLIFNENKLADTIIIMLICPYQLDWLVSHISLIRDLILSFFVRLKPILPFLIIRVWGVKLHISCFMKLTSSRNVLTKYGNTCSGKHEFECRIHNTYIIYKLQSLNRNNDRFYCLFLVGYFDRGCFLRRWRVFRPGKLFFKVTINH